MNKLANKFECGTLGFYFIFIMLPTCFKLFGLL